METCEVHWFRKTGVVEITSNGETVTHILSRPATVTVRNWIVGLEGRYGEGLVILDKGRAVLYGPAADSFLRVFNRKFGK